MYNIYYSNIFCTSGTLPIWLGWKQRAPSHFQNSSKNIKSVLSGGNENTETSANIRELPGGNGGSTREELANKFCSQLPLQPQYAKESQSSEITFSGQKENRVFQYSYHTIYKQLWGMMCKQLRSINANGSQCIFTYCCQQRVLAKARTCFCSHLVFLNVRSE